MIWELLFHFDVNDHIVCRKAKQTNRRWVKLFSLHSKNQNRKLTETESLLIIEFRSDLFGIRWILNDWEGRSIDDEDDAPEFSCLAWCRWTRSPMARRNEFRETGIIIFYSYLNEATIISIVHLTMDNVLIQ